jgi:hypothetical protein
MDEDLKSLLAGAPSATVKLKLARAILAEREAAGLPTDPAATWARLVEAASGDQRLAGKAYLKLLQGRSVETVIGPVLITGKTSEKMRAGFSKEGLKPRLVPYVPHILRGTYLGGQQSTKQRSDGITAFYYFAAAVNLGDMTVTAGVSVGESMRGQKVLTAYELADEMHGLWAERTKGTSVYPGPEPGGEVPSAVEPKLDDVGSMPSADGGVNFAEIEGLDFEILQVLDAAGAHMPELEDRPSVSAAVVALEVALDTLTTNEPINRADGKSAQAELEARSAAEMKTALELLRFDAVELTPEQEALCRQKYEDYFHKIAATVSYSQWRSIWRYALRSTASGAVLDAVPDLAALRAAIASAASAADKLAAARALQQARAAREAVPVPATRADGIKALTSIKPFLSSAQFSTMRGLMEGEEGQYFVDKAIEMAKLIDAMPATYKQDGMGDAAVVWLHYFKGSGDWWITEKDVDGGVDQAFGLADLYGDGGEMGYISIRELVQHGVELDLHFQPRPLSVVRAKDQAQQQEAPLPSEPSVATVAVQHSDLPALADRVAEAMRGQASDLLAQSETDWQGYSAAVAQTVQAIDSGTIFVLGEPEHFAGMVRDRLRVFVQTQPITTAAEFHTRLKDALGQGAGSRNADLAMLAQITAGTHPRMLEPELSDEIEGALARWPGDSEIERAVEAAILTYSSGAISATA